MKASGVSCVYARDERRVDGRKRTPNQHRTGDIPYCSTWNIPRRRSEHKRAYAVCVRIMIVTQYSLLIASSLIIVSAAGESSAMRRILAGIKWRVCRRCLAKYRQKFMESVARRRATCGYYGKLRILTCCPSRPSCRVPLPGPR